MELRQLEHFVAVAEEGQFTRAAARLHIVQSGLSASIRTLERALGAQLFVRNTHRVALTEAGRNLLGEARRTLAAAAAARASVTAVQGLLAGSVSVGTMHFAHVIDLASVLGRFHARHPGVEIRLRQGGAAGIVEAVRAGELDVAFTSMPGRPPGGVDFHRLAEEALILICPTTHRLAGREKVELSALAEETFIDFTPDWGPRMAVDRSFTAIAVRRRIGFEVNDVTMMLQLVKHGLGVGFIPEAIAEATPEVARLRFPRHEPRLRYSVAVPTGGPISAAAQVLLGEIRGTRVAATP
jgi:DNA-binding transcriptional LysR family regulator